MVFQLLFCRNAVIDCLISGFSQFFPFEIILRIGIEEMNNIPMEGQTDFFFFLCIIHEVSGIIHS